MTQKTIVFIGFFILNGIALTHAQDTNEVRKRAAAAFGELDAQPTKASGVRSTSGVESAPAKGVPNSVPAQQVAREELEDAPTIQACVGVTGTSELANLPLAMTAARNRTRANCVTKVCPSGKGILTFSDPKCNHTRNNNRFNVSCAFTENVAVTCKQPRAAVKYLESQSGEGPSGNEAL